MTALVVVLSIGALFGFVTWARRKAADLRGHRLPPMRLL